LFIKMQDIKVVGNILHLISKHLTIYCFEQTQKKAAPGTFPDATSFTNN